MGKIEQRIKNAGRPAKFNQRGDAAAGVMQRAVELAV